MPNWTTNDLKKQCKRAADKGWLPFFQDSGADYTFDAVLLMAIASRETNMKNIIGDGGHGYGIMQIDDRSFPEWCHSGAWQDVEQGIAKGALVLDGKRTNVEKNQGKKIVFGKKSFVGKANLTAAEILRISISSYNCGWWAYYNFSKGHDVDKSSTGHDYSADVLSRMATIRNILFP